MKYWAKATPDKPLAACSRPTVITLLRALAGEPIAKIGLFMSDIILCIFYLLLTYGLT